MNKIIAPLVDALQSNTPFSVMELLEHVVLRLADKAPKIEVDTALVNHLREAKKELSIANKLVDKEDSLFSTTFFTELAENEHVAYAIRWINQLEASLRLGDYAKRYELNTAKVDFSESNEIMTEIVYLDTVSAYRELSNLFLTVSLIEHRKMPSSVKNRVKSSYNIDREAFWTELELMTKVKMIENPTKYKCMNRF